MLCNNELFIIRFEALTFWGAGELDTRACRQSCLSLVPRYSLRKTKQNQTQTPQPKGIPTPLRLPISWSTQPLRAKRNLIAQEDLGGGALPAAVAAGADHEGAGGVEVELGDDAGAVAGDDEEGGCGGVCGSGLV